MKPTSGNRREAPVEKVPEPASGALTHTLELLPSSTMVASQRQAIINRVWDWSGGEKQAAAWYEDALIPALGYKTAEQIVELGKADDVHAYIDHLADGGFA